MGSTNSSSKDIGVGETVNGNGAWLTMNGLLWAGLLIVASCIAQPVHAQLLAHNDAIIRCSENFPVEKAVLLKTESQANGTVFEYYDRNDDEKVDIIAISHQIDGGNEHISYPFMWIVDHNFDSIPDAVYVDVGEKNECKNIKLYKDLRKPHPEENDQRQEGYVGSFDQRGRP